MVNECVCCKPPWEFIAPQIETIVDCAECPDGISKCWEMTVAGVSGEGTGTGFDECCSGFNGTYILRYIEGQNDPNGTFCYFETDERAIECCNGTSTSIPLWQMRPSGPTNWFLNPLWVNDSGTLSVAHSYVLATASFDCTGTNIFAGSSLGGTFVCLPHGSPIRRDVCDDFPATITIEPTVC